MAQIEEKLAEMELAARKEEAPSLYSDYNVGFEVIEADDNEKRAVGVRVFTIGGNLVYAPIFFYQGRLFGKELMFLKEQDIFVPFEETWINYVLGKEPLRLGEPREDAPGTLPSQPDLSTFYEAPEAASSLGPKRASVNKDLVKEASRPLNEDIDLKEAYKEASAETRQRFRRFLSTDLKVAEDIIRRHDLSEVIGEEDETVDLFKDASSSHQGTFVATDPDDVNTQERALEIYKKGYSIVKEAAPETQVVHDDENCFFSPTSTGVFNVVTEEGEKEALVVRPKKNYPAFDAQGDQGETQLEVIFWNGKGCKTVPSSEVTAVEEDKHGRWGELYNNLNADTISAKRGPTYNEYVFMGPKSGQAYGPVRVKEKINLPNGQTKLKTVLSQDVIITTSSGNLSFTKDAAYVPENWKALQLKDSDLHLLTIGRALQKMASPLEIKDHTGSRKSIHFDGTKSMVKDAADEMKVLMEDVGLSREDAEYIRSRQGVQSKFHIVKNAQVSGGSMRPSPTARLSGGPAMSAAAPGGPGPAGPGQEQGLPPGTMKAMQTAQQALQQGQSDVVDTSALSALLSSSDSPHYIRKYLGDLLTAVDRCGRILFVMYWHRDDFIEAFGLKELETHQNELKSAFETLGREMLKLKQELSGPEKLPIFD